LHLISKDNGVNRADQKLYRGKPPGKKISSRLYYNFSNDAYNYQQKNNNKLIFYCITATPIILLTLPKVLDNVKPDLEGSYTKNDNEIIETIKKSKRLDKFSAGHPYVLKGVAVNTKYSMSEEARLKEFELKNEIKYLKDYVLMNRRATDYL